MLCVSALRSAIERTAEQYCCLSADCWVWYSAVEGSVRCVSPSSVCSSPCAATGIGRGDGLFRAPRSDVLSLSSALESGRLTTSQICRCRLTHRAARSSSPAASSTPKAWQKAPNPKPSAEAEEPSLCPMVSAHSSRKRVELVGSPSSRRPTPNCSWVTQLLRVVSNAANRCQTVQHIGSSAEPTLVFCSTRRRCGRRAGQSSPDRPPWTCLTKDR